MLLPNVTYSPFPEERNFDRERGDALRRRRLLPYPCHTDVEQDRLFHRDLGDLTRDEIAAEQLLLSNEYATRIFNHVRPSYWVGADMADIDWILQRIQRLKSLRCKP